MAKILLFTKAYDTEANTLKEIEASVQADLDTYLEKPGMVKVRLHASKDMLSFWLYRQYKTFSPTSSAQEDCVQLEDCQFLTGGGCLGFELPYSWGGIPYLNVMPMIVWMDKKALFTAYKKSSKIMGLDVPKKMTAESNETYFLATLTYPKLKVKLEPQSQPQTDLRKIRSKRT